MNNTNLLQDSMIRYSRPGRPAGDVYEAVMADMEAAGIQAQVYSHPLGSQGMPRAPRSTPAARE